MTGRRFKGILKEYLRTHQETYDTDHVPWLYSFVYWLEGQDLEPIECRYHPVPATESLEHCPFNQEGRE